MKEKVMIMIISPSYVFEKVDIFAKPLLPGLSSMTRGQTNEMLWAVRHLIPQSEVINKHNRQRDMTGQIETGFWLRYAKAMRGLDKRAQVIPLSINSPGALQKIWDETVAPNSLALAKEVHFMDRRKQKLLDVVDANKTDSRIPSCSAPSTQSPPAS